MSRFAIGPDDRLYDPRMRAVIAAASPAGRLNALEAAAAVGFAAKRLHHRTERWADQHDLSEGRLQALFALSFNESGMALGELAEALNVSPRNVTGLIDHLERDGLVTRRPEPGDRRSVLAALTGRGRELVTSLRKEWAEHLLEVTDELSDEELDQLRHLCLRLVSRLDDREKQTKEAVHGG